jgi:hypothetical protein
MSVADDGIRKRYTTTHLESAPFAGNKTDWMKKR